jgi:hypothetical protein
MTRVLSVVLGVAVELNGVLGRDATDVDGGAAVLLYCRVAVLPCCCVAVLLCCWIAVLLLWCRIEAVR